MHAIHRSPVLAAGLVVLASTATVASAQQATPTRPDAGTLMRQIEQQPPKLPEASKPKLVTPPELKPQGDLAVTVTRFEFSGNTLVADAALQAAVKPWLNRPLDFNGLRAAAAAAAEVYRAAGWVVRAYLPQQEIDQGTVRIHIVEALFGAVRVEPMGHVPVSVARVERTILGAQRPGRPLGANAIDRALLLVDDLPGVEVMGHLAAGQRDGETDLIAVVAPSARVSGDVTLDNTGARSTGANRIAGAVSANSLLGAGDLLTANLIHTDGSDYVRGAVTLPLGYSGLRAGVSASHLQYRVVSPEFTALDLKGSSSNSGVDLVYPIIRGRSRNLYVDLGWEHKTFENRSAALDISHYKIDVATLALSGNRVDTLGGGGVNMASLAFASGKVDLSGSANQTSDAAGLRTQGTFTKIRYTLSRNQAFTPNLSGSVALNGQLASKNLDSGERIYLGGVGGVRAYPSNEAGGSDGTILDLEARYRLPRNVTASVFYDWGTVTVNHDNSFPGAATRNTLSLQGAGVSLGWVAPFGLNARLTYARRIGHNPNPTLSGRDQDGSLDLNRVWAVLYYSF